MQCLYIEVTNLCPYARCALCYSQPTRDKKSAKYMPYTLLRHVIEKLVVDYDLRQVEVSTGDITATIHIAMLLHIAREFNIRVRVHSSGLLFLMSYDLVQHVVRARDYAEVAFPLYGPDARTHGEVASPDHFLAILTAAKMLSREGVQVSLTFVLRPGLCSEDVLSEIEELRSRLGIDYVELKLHPRAKPSREELERVLSYISTTSYKHVKLHCSLRLSEPCPAGKTHIAVSADGLVYPCLEARPVLKPVAHIRDVLWGSAEIERIGVQSCPLKHSG